MQVHRILENNLIFTLFSSSPSFWLTELILIYLAMWVYFMWMVSEVFRIGKHQSVEDITAILQTTVDLTYSLKAHPSGLSTLGSTNPI